MDAAKQGDSAMTKMRFGAKWFTASIAAIALSAGVAGADDTFSIDLDPIDTLDTIERFDRFDRLETYSTEITLDEIGLDVSVGGKFESASLDVSFQVDEMGTITGIESGYSEKGWGDKALKWIAGKLGDLLGGGGGGGGGGSSTTCNVNVNIEGGTQGGPVTINVGNLNCGSQSGGSGGGNNGGGK
jgi:hypothetical protein